MNEKHRSTLYPGDHGHRIHDSNSVVNLALLMCWKCYSVKSMNLIYRPAFILTKDRLRHLFYSSYESGFSFLSHTGFGEKLEKISN